MRRVSVFGDGDHRNGDEDSRVALASPNWRQQRFGSWSLSAGTIHCDGKLRGTAMVLNTDELSLKPQGHVLITAAHVLFDLDSGRMFRECRFHYMGLGRLPGYQAAIDLETARMGRFDPLQAREQLTFGREDWAFLHVPTVIPAIVPEARIQPKTFNDVTDRPVAGQSYRLLAWSERHAAISMSLACTPVESQAGDLGGGSWSGQILDDCDSGQGASGGGLIASDSGSAVLVGIRTGSHWDAVAYPSQSFPQGPLAGAAWDIRHHTNFARAIDRGLLEELGSFLHTLVPKTSL